MKPGDNVFCTDMTFAATVNPVLYEKANPIFIDTEYDTWNMDPAALEKAFELYPDTKVIILYWILIHTTNTIFNVISFVNLKRKVTKCIVYHIFLLWWGKGCVDFSRG